MPRTNNKLVYAEKVKYFNTLFYFLSSEKLFLKYLQLRMSLLESFTYFSKYTNPVIVLSTLY